MEHSIHWQKLERRHSSTIFHQGVFVIWHSCRNYIHNTSKSSIKNCQKCIGMLIKLRFIICQSYHFLLVVITFCITAETAGIACKIHLNLIVVYAGVSQQK